MERGCASTRQTDPCEEKTVSSLSYISYIKFLHIFFFDNNKPFHPMYFSRLWSSYQLQTLMRFKSAAGLLILNNQSVVSHHSSL